ncbi:TPA: hypothetical protein DIC39_01440, partial [Patescibacteria group bacterium]|nr:hypothetical protein [Patescibacteria group bacterium]
MGKSKAKFAHIFRQIFKGSVMVHSPNKSAQVTKHSFNFRGETKLPFSVNILFVLDWPPVFNA